jgi:mannose/cellobiose epimerase-like protein (N-acyl-D-glucosamine 2-epimerase family)
MLPSRRAGITEWAFAAVLLLGCQGASTNESTELRQALDGVNLKATIQKTNSWPSGYCATVNITNLGSVAASTWTAVIELNQATMYSSWNGNVTGSGSRKTITPVGWNATVNPGAVVSSFGYCANITGSNSTPIVISPTGDPGSDASVPPDVAIPKDTSVPRDVAKDTSVPRDVAKDTSLPRDVAKDTALPPDLAKDTSLPRDVAKDTALPPDLAKDTSLPRDVAKDTALPPDLARDTSLPRDVAKDTALPPDLAKDTSLPRDVGADGATGYSPTSEFLLHPERSVAVLQSLADFRVRARDNTNGGFFSFTNLNGYVGSDRRKSFVVQSRDAWTFARAFMVTGDETYLGHADHALAFLHKYGWDNTRGGWYFTSNEYGQLTPYTPGWDPNTYRWSFVQHYDILGSGAYCEATRDTSACDWFKKGSNYLDTKMWDSTAGRIGYYEEANLDASNPRNKGFTGTVDALTTNALQSELLWPTTGNYAQRIVDLAGIVSDRLAANMDLASVKFGYPENYNASWGVNTSSTGGDVGHVLKSAWVLARVYLRHPDARYRTAARKLIYEVLNNGGWDEPHGVPYTTYNWSSGSITKKAECWQIQQAIMGGLSNWYIADNQTDRDTYLRMADRSLQFFYDHVIDHTNGGTYKMNNVDGSAASSTKGNFYNVEYHSTETFYFTYLYASLMLQKTPVALYYKVPASPSQQVIQLNPVGIDDAAMKIQSVTLDGSPLTTFSGATREVTLAAGQGGKLRVVFGQ